MPKGFFTETVMAKAAVVMSRVPKCGACGLYKSCKSPKLEPMGNGKRKILIVAETPGREEDDKGEQLVGNSARKLIEVLRRADIDLRRDCWLTSALICYPGEHDANDKRITHCRPNLFNTIETLQPEIIIPLGQSAVKSLIGGIWKSDVGAIGKWVGWKIPCQKLNTWICPMHHPSYLFKMKDPVVEKYFEHHLTEAVALEGRPWKKVPDYKKQVDLVFDGAHAASILRECTPTAEVIAFDYETNMLKPDSDLAKIVSASVCFDGKRTIAFPFTNVVIEEWVELMRSSCRKIASNIKFEDRWTRAILGVAVKNWWWDTMLAAHVMDNRPDITGLKFQAFAMLGAEAHDKLVRASLRAQGEDRVNEIENVDLDEMLLYNGLDSLLEYKIAMKQRKMMYADFASHA